MSWNTPRKSENIKPKTRKPATLLWAFIVGAVFVGGIVVYCLTSPSLPQFENDENRRVRKVATVREQIPEAVTESVPKEKEYSEMDNSEKLKYWKDMYGDNPPENIKPIIYYLENPPKRNFKSKESKYKIFAHTSERHIAALLSVRPGTWMLRPPVYDNQFDQDFAQSMAERIEITKEDTDEQRALKNAVIETKKEFAQRMKQGETPSDIMNAAAQELYELGQFRRDLELEIAKVRRDPEASDDDYTLLVEAANKMLDSKGLPKLRQPSIFGRQCMLQRKLENNQSGIQKGAK